MSAAVSPETKLTFRPLNRGWFRCNQTGVKIKNCKSYAHSIFGNQRKRRSKNGLQKIIERKAVNLPKVTLSISGNWVCPSWRSHRRMDYYNFSSVTGVIDICSCGQKVYISGRENGVIY